VRLAPQPTQQHAHQHVSVEPVGLGTPYLAWNRNTGWVDHIDFDTACPQPTRQPETVTPSLECNNYPLYNFAGPAGFLAPYLELFEQAILVNRQFLQRTPIDTRNIRQYQPR